MSDQNGKPKDQIVGLKSLRLNAAAVSYIPRMASTPEKVFTPDEWAALKCLDSLELFLKYQNGARTIAVLEHPSIINLTRGERGQLSSIYRYWMEGIKKLIEERDDPVSQSIIQKIEEQYHG